MAKTQAEALAEIEAMTDRVTITPQIAAEALGKNHMYFKAVTEHKEWDVAIRKVLIQDEHAILILRIPFIKILKGELT